MRALRLPCLAAALALATPGFAEAEESRAPEGPPVVDQSVYPDSPNGCAPASVLNLLRFSDEPYRSAFDRVLGRDDAVRMRFVVDRYFRNRPSTVRPGRRWGVHGVASEDILIGLNELLEENEIDPLRGRYLDRREGESEAELLERVHRMIWRSIDRGVRPILSLRSFVVQTDDGGEPGWAAGKHHSVVVAGVSDEVSSSGVELEILDPWQGRRGTIYLHVEPNGQSFRALRGNEESGRWLNGRPFLQVLAPGMGSLRPRDLEWSERFVVTANYLIGKY